MARYIFIAMYSFVPPFREATFRGVPSCVWQIRVCTCGCGTLKYLVNRVSSFSMLTLQQTGQFLFTKVSVRIKAKSRYTPWRRMGGGRYSSYSFLTLALSGGEWSASRPGRALPSKNVGTHKAHQYVSIAKRIVLEITNIGYFSRLGEKSFSVVWIGPVTWLRHAAAMTHSYRHQPKPLEWQFLPRPCWRKCFSTWHQSYKQLLDDTRFGRRISLTRDRWKMENASLHPLNSRYDVANQ
jgi:hypothetical protein